MDKSTEKYDLDMTSYGPVIDDDEESVGWEPCLKNLENLLITLHEEPPKNIDISTKILVLRSVIIREEEKPYRSSEETIKTFSDLLKEYRLWRNEFDLENVKNKKQLDFEASEKQGEKNEAWGPFMYVSRVANESKQINELLTEEKNVRMAEKIIKKKGLGNTYRTHF